MKPLLFILGLAALACSQVHALNCEPLYQGKKFVAAIIYSPGSSQIGPAECSYDSTDGNKMIYYRFPKGNKYYAVSGNWQLEIPGTRVCSAVNGDTYNSCQFALRGVK